MQMPAWTYSQLDSFESCPKKFYHLKVIRDVVEPETVHQTWGKDVHTAFEDAIDKGDPLPESMAHWQPIATKIAQIKGVKYTEQKYALDKNFAPADWSNAWTRGIADLVILRGDQAAVMDYKTGKKKPTEQLDLYACYLFKYHPEIKTVNTGLVWLKERKMEWKSIRADEQHVVWQGLLPRVRKLESAYERDSWPAKPSGLCRQWCAVFSCEFNGRRNER